MADGDYKLLIVGAAVKGATSSIVKDYVERVVVPYVRGLANNKIQKAIKANLARYLKSVEHRTRALPSIAIPSGVFPLEDVYEPLSIKNDAEDLHLVIDSYPSELFRHSRCVALTDDAGMGKSTLAKFLVRSAINEGKNIPLLVELRRLRSGVSMLNMLCSELADGSTESPAGAEIVKLFMSGNFLFVLDGYDEIEDELRADVAQEINELAARFQFCYFVLTSRKEYGGALFPDFAHFEICKLTEPQAHSLIRRYDQGRGIAKQLIAKIKDVGVNEFLGNPLLVTLLYRAFDYRQVVPPKRSVFFRQVYDALFQDHDLGKGGGYERSKECSLDIDDFHRVVRSLGFVTLKSGRVSYSPEEFCSHLEEAVARSNINVDWRKLKADLVRSVPIFVKDGMEFRWSHKAFQEYFAAQYVAYDMGGAREEMVRRIFESDEVFRFREVLRFVVEADTALVRDCCIEPLLSTIDAKADPQVAVDVMSRSTEIFFFSKFEFDSSNPNMHSSVMDIAKSLFGDRFHVGRLVRSVVNMEGEYAVISLLKDDGLKFLMLPYIDRELFPPLRKTRRLDPYRVWASVIGKEYACLNDELRARPHLLEELGGLDMLSEITQIPVISRATIDKVVLGKDERRKLMESAIFEGF